MRDFFIRASKFAAALLVCTIASIFIWERFIAGTVYHCTDPGFLGFLSPGHWGHAPRYGDTMRAGWSTTGLWCLWYSFVVTSVVVSIAFAALPRRYRSSHEHVTHNAA
jgi:hypothetical protein